MNPDAAPREPGVDLHLFQAVVSVPARIWWALLLGVLLVGACGEAGGPTPSTREEVSPEVSEEVLAELTVEIKALEREVTPGKGTPREVVERRFGKGTPHAISKAKVPVPPDSPVRKYEFGGDVLLVRYGEEDAVRWAHFVDPLASKGLALGQVLPLELRFHEARRRLTRLQAIRDRLRRHHTR